MDLSILVVNWNAGQALGRCIASVLAHTRGLDYEILVVDNASADGSLAAVQARFGAEPRLVLLPQMRNLGFAAANNLAYERSRGDCILLLNPDTELRDNALASLVAFLRSDDTIGVVGPQLRYPDGRLQPSCRRFPRTRHWLVILSGLHRFASMADYYMSDFDHRSQRDVDQVMGSALMTRRSVVDRVGFLDGRFFLWFEEVDYCKRVREAGYRVVFYPQATVVHRGGQSSGLLSRVERRRLLIPSLLLYFRKHGNRLDGLLLGSLVPWSLGLAWLGDRMRPARTLG